MQIWEKNYKTETNIYVYLTYLIYFIISEKNTSVLQTCAFFYKTNKQKKKTLALKATILLS